MGLFDEWGDTCPDVVDPNGNNSKLLAINSPWGGIDAGTEEIDGKASGRVDPAVTSHGGLPSAAAGFGTTFGPSGALRWPANVGEGAGLFASAATANDDPANTKTVILPSNVFAVRLRDRSRRLVLLSIMSSSLLHFTKGINSLPGFTQEISGSTSLDTSKRTSTGLGGHAAPNASLLQGFVLQSSIEQYGMLNHGLGLPVPAVFSVQHPGPIEVYLRVFSVTTSSEAQSLLIDGSLSGSDDQEHTDQPNYVIDAGMAGSINSLANRSSSNFRFQWVLGRSYYDINIPRDPLIIIQAQTLERSAVGYVYGW